MWARLGLRSPAAALGADGGQPEAGAGRGGAVPSRATPVSFALRDNLPWLLAAARGDARPILPGAGAARDLLDCLRARGALFYRELVGGTGRLRVEVEEGLWDLVSRGLVTADGFGSVRTLLTARERWAKRAARLPKQRRLRRQAGEGYRRRRPLVAPAGRRRPRTAPASTPTSRRWPRRWPSSSWPATASSSAI